MRQVNKVSAICMLLALVCVGLAGFLGHFAPAPLPTDPVQKVAEFYQQYGHKILIFAFFNCMATGLMLPGFCALSVAMMRMRPVSPTLAVIQVTAGTVATIGPFLASMFMAAGVIRPHVSPDILGTLTDLAVLFIELSTLPALLQLTSLAVAIFKDRSPARVLPLWFGWVSLIWGVCTQGGLFAIFNDTGPLSSNGVIGIVLPIVTLVIWMLAASIVLFRAPALQES